MQASLYNIAPPPPQPHNQNTHNQNTFGPTEGQNEQWREANRRRQRQTIRYRGLVPTPPPPQTHIHTPHRIHSQHPRPLHQEDNFSEADKRVCLRAKEPVSHLLDLWYNDLSNLTNLTDPVDLANLSSELCITDMCCVNMTNSTWEYIFGVFDTSTSTYYIVTLSLFALALFGYMLGWYMRAKNQERLQLKASFIVPETAGPAGCAPGCAPFASRFVGPVGAPVPTVCPLGMSGFHLWGGGGQ